MGLVARILRCVPDVGRHVASRPLGRRATRPDLAGRLLELSLARHDRPNRRMAPRMVLRRIGIDSAQEAKLRALRDRPVDDQPDHQMTVAPRIFVREGGAHENRDIGLCGCSCPIDPRLFAPWISKEIAEP